MEEIVVQISYSQKDLAESKYVRCTYSPNEKSTAGTRDAVVGFSIGSNSVKQVAVLGCCMIALGLGQPGNLKLLSVRWSCRPSAGTAVVRSKAVYRLKHI